MSAVSDFTLALSDLRFVGNELSRPESVFVDKAGALWTSDSRGGVCRIDADGKQTVVGALKGEPNGFYQDADGSFIVADIAVGKFFTIQPDGTSTVLLDEIDGKPLGSANFVTRDSKGRLWLTVSTRALPWSQGIIEGRQDGYVVLIDEHGPRIVADGVNFANELHFDAAEEYAYVAETMGSRILRYRVGEDGALSEKTVFGPESLGEGAWVDGFAIDSEGNLWATTVVRNGLVVIEPDGSHHVVFEDVRAEAVSALVAKVAAGTMQLEDMFPCMGETLRCPTSVVFGGDDLRTVYMGSLAMPHLLSFRAPVAGLPARR